MQTKLTDHNVRPSAPPVYRPQQSPIPRQFSPEPALLVQPSNRTKPVGVASSLQPKLAFQPPPPVYNPFRLIQRKPAAFAPSTIQLKRGNKKKNQGKYKSVDPSMLGFTVAHTQEPEIKIEWSTVTDRETWWSKLGYTPKEGDVNCRINRLGDIHGKKIHATITKSEVPSKIDTSAEPLEIAKTLLGKKFHVTLETNSGNSGAHYFYGDGASDALKNQYPDYLEELQGECWDEFNGVVSQIAYLLGR
jgi:hypothetical protein